MYGFCVKSYNETTNFRELLDMQKLKADLEMVTPAHLDCLQVTAD